MTTTIYDFSTGAGFVYDANKVAFGGGKASLKLVPNPSQIFSQDFASDIGFTYDPSLVEFVGGVVQQKSQLPPNATFGAKFNSFLDANWGDGPLTCTPFNGAAIAGGKLDLSGGGDKRVTFDATGGNATPTLTTVGCVRFRFTPNYNGTPVANQIFFNLTNGVNGNNEIELFHATNGEFFMLFNDQNGVNQVSSSVAPYSAVAGQEIEVEVSWDLNLGKIYFFGEGFLIANPDVSFTRSNDITTIGIGDTGSDFFVRDLVLFDTVQHTTNYDPAYTLPAGAYVYSVVLLPAFSYAGLGSLQAFTGFAATSGGTPRYTIGGKYWTGSAWATSDGSYAQASDAATVASHIATFAAANALVVALVFPDSNVQSSCDLLTTTYTGQIYPADNPTIKPSAPLSLDQLTAFTDVEHATGSDGVKWQLLIGSVKKWWNGSAWATSDGTYAQANTAAEIAAHESTVPLGDGAYVTPIALLHSADGSSTPDLTSLTISYHFFGPAPTPPPTCAVFGYLLDETQAPVVNATISATNVTTYFSGAGGVIIAQGTLTTKTNAEGYFEFELSETASTSKKVGFSVAFALPRKDTFDFGKAIIPNQPTANFVDLTFTP